MAVHFLEGTTSIPAIDVRPRPRLGSSQTSRSEDDALLYQAPAIGLQTTGEDASIPLPPQLVLEAISLAATPPQSIDEEETSSPKRHKAQRARPTKQDGRKQSPAYKCSVCHRQFSRNEHMVRHERARKSLYTHAFYVLCQRSLTHLFRSK